jgi:hypothetical protein
MRDDKFPDEGGKHFSAKKAALFLNDLDVGKKYTTHGPVYDLPDSLRTVGMLEAIYDILNEMHKQRDNTANRLEKHACYLDRHWKRDTMLLQRLNREADRIHKLCGGIEILLDSYDTRWALRTDISELASLYVDGMFDGYALMHVYNTRIARLETTRTMLKQIRSIDGLSVLYGIGKVTVTKIKAHVKSIGE